MSDPAKLSDAELLAALNGQPQPAGLAAMSDADLLKALGPQPVVAQSSVPGDLAKSVGSGLAKGAVGLVGGIGDMANFLGHYSDVSGDYIARQLGFEGRAPLQNVVAESAGSKSIGAAVDKLSGAPVTSYKPETTAGKFAQTAAEFVPGSLMGPGGIARNVIGYGVIPGLASEAAGQATEGTKLEPVARIAAAIAAGAVPGLASRAVTPLPISPERQKLVDALAREGVPLTAGQKTGSTPLRYAESIFGESPGAGGQTARIMEAQGEAFTDAAMRRAGASGLATPEALQGNYTRLSNEFETLSARNTLTADTQLGQDIGKTLREYDKILPSEQRKIIGNLATEIVDKFSAGGGKMTGTDYQSIRSRLSKRAQNARGKDDDYADAARGLRNALDNGMKRSISPEDAQAWDLARKEWGAQKILERAAGGAGTEAAQGRISPAQLRIAAALGDKSGYARGQGDFAELARAGSALMTPLPNSGTGQRMNLAQILGAGAGGASGGVLGAVAGAAAPGVAGRVLMSRPVQSYLGNQLLTGGNAGADRVAKALLALRAAGLPIQ